MVQSQSFLGMLEKADALFEAKMMKLFGSPEEVKMFKEAKGIPDRIAMVWKNKLTQELLKMNEVIVDEKSEGETRRNRDIGNKHFQAGKWEKAAEYFSLAVCFAPQNERKQGRDLSLAFANRSASMYHLGRLEDSLEDIEFALASGYPAELRYKVYERQVYCYTKLGMLDQAKSAGQLLEQHLSASKLDDGKRSKIRSEAFEYINQGESVVEPRRELSSPWMEVPTLSSSNPDLPGFSDAVSLKYEASRGRFCVASRDINVGEILGVEEPVTSCLYYERRDVYCDNCFKYIPLRQLPCDFCSALRFCSTQCKKSAMETYHQHECGREDVFASVLGKMLQEGKRNADSTKKFHRLAFKTVTQKSLAWFVGNRGKVENIDSKSRLVQRSGYEGLASLVGHHQLMPLPRIFAFLMSSVFHLRNLQLSGYFGSRKVKVYEKLTADEMYIAELLYTCLEKMQFNTHAVVSGLPDSEQDLIDGQLQKELLYENKVRCIGHALYPSLAMLNHSCYNNVYKYNLGNTVVILASQRIQAGEEVTENYFPVVQVMPRPDRRSWLAESYWFDCSCRGCVENYPVMMKIQSTPTNLRCQRSGCNGLVTELQCKVCTSRIDREAVLQEVEKLWNSLQQDKKYLHSYTEYNKLKTVAESVRKKCSRLMKIVSMPCSLLYQSELLLWRSFRLLSGNRMY